MTEEKRTRPARQEGGMENREKNGFVQMKGFSDRTEKPALLLHSCCGPCSTAVIERLAGDYQITIFFYNPCITDQEEYQKRKDAQLEFVKKYNESLPPKERICVKEGPYDTKNFYRAAAGLEQEPEGGKRCLACFWQRLEKTAETCKLAGYDYFGTTLTVSPHKNYELISSIGRKLAVKYSLSFLDQDFKKKDGFKRSIQLSRQYGLYRQNYCGCEYSKRQRENQKQEKQK
ncbi:epoxyqueuosine reductase QueH [bacterium 210820-DFI.6.37]|nr:epoxyqueuosine reductase QueH [bacterium 210820-DFI.6.37]